MTASDDIAIVGIGCVLPDAASPTAFRENVRAGRSAILDLGSDDAQWRRFADRDGAEGDTSYSLLGAAVRGYSFDWRRFRIPPVDAAMMNPMQLLALDAGDQALRDVRVVPRETTGLFFGAVGLGWQVDSGLQIRFPDLVAAFGAAPANRDLPPESRDALLAAVRENLRRTLKPVTDDTVVNASASVAAGRLAMHYDLHGPHYSIDAGYASSLAALEVGVVALRNGTVDLAVVGGVSEPLSAVDLVAFARIGALARTRVAPFDAAGEGTALGEGAVMFALKRLEDALRDGETIHAIVRGVTGATDPPERALLAPSERGQVELLRLAYASAGVDPGTIGFIECHATGTRLGDATEVRALAAVFRESPEAIALGSAKPFVGHLRAASGAVGLLRAIHALEHRCIPAQINFTAPHPDLALSETRLRVPRTAEPLASRGGAPVPRVAVNSFGFGGNSYHAILERFDPSVHRRSARAAAPRRTSSEPLAVIGMGSVLPQAIGVDALWLQLLAGFDATREVPAERWHVDRYVDPDPTRLETAYSRLGCFLERYPPPAPAWRIPPAALASIDPEQLVLLEAAEEALSDAGFAPGKWPAERVGVSVGFLPYQGKRFLADLRVNSVAYVEHLRTELRAAGFAGADLERRVAQTEAELKRGLPHVTEDSLTGWLGSIGAARVARRWAFRGPHFGVDSACASSHAALHASYAALRANRIDVAIVGGVWCDMMPEFFVAACRFNALSATGITPFDASADGFIPGEGAGVLVVRRLADAERGGDRIHAVIRAVEGSSDGRGRSVLAPRPEGEAMAMRRALSAASIPPSSIDYVECHGTGTALGDKVEVEATARAYDSDKRRDPLLIGSVKSNVGHLNAAAGMPAMIKAVLAVREGLIPPTIKCTTPNPAIDFAGTHIRVVTQPTRWVKGDGSPRRAGVSGFGVGGTNMHLVVEEYRAGTRMSVAVGDERMQASPRIVAVSGTDVAECIRQLEEIARSADGDAAAGFTAVADRSRERAGERQGIARCAMVVHSSADLASRVRSLSALVERGHDPAVLRAQGVFVGAVVDPATIALTFPGQGPQYPGMLSAAMGAFPSVASTLQRIDAAYERSSGHPMSPLILDTTRAALPAEDVHCAVFAVNCAVLELLRAHGLRYGAVVGQSAGELSALVAAGVLTLEDALSAVRARTRAVLDLALDDAGRMIALVCSADRAAELCRRIGGDAWVAADNSPSASIVSARTAAARSLLALAAAEGIDATELDVSHGYHSPIIGDARSAYGRALAQLTFRPPNCEIVSTITGMSIRSLPPARYPALLTQQFVQPVRLRQAIEELYAGGTRVFVECGPKWPLTTYVDDVLSGRTHAAQATMHPKIGEVEQLTRALAHLFVLGAADIASVAPHPS